MTKTDESQAENPNQKFDTLLSSQRVSSHSCETLRELQHVDPEKPANGTSVSPKFKSVIIKQTWRHLHAVVLFVTLRRNEWRNEISETEPGTYEEALKCSAFFPTKMFGLPNKSH